MTPFPPVTLIGPLVSSVRNSLPSTVGGVFVSPAQAVVPSSGCEKLATVDGLIETLTLLVPVTSWPFECRHVTVTSEMKGEPR